MVKLAADISKYISKPDQILEADIAILNEEAVKNPWCSTYQILLAKGHKNEDSHFKNRQLRLAATYAGDRDVLFNFMHGSMPIADVEISEVKEVIDETKESEVLPNLESTKETQVEEHISATEKLPIVEEKEAIQTPNREPVEAKAVKDTNVIEKETKELETEQAAAEPLLEQAQNEKLVNTATEIEESEKEDNEPKELEIDFDKIVVYDPLAELTPIEREEKTEGPLYNTLAYDPERELTKIIEQKEGQEEGDFTFWLNNMDADKPASKPSAKSPDKVQQLLDQFLATKRTRPIQKQKFYSAENRAEQSEKDDMSVLSETLVELYVKQGHTARAIAGYKKLSLQNPEKSAYFAARIKELDESPS